MQIVEQVSSDISVAIVAMVAACLLPYGFALWAKMAGGFSKADNANTREFFAKATGMSARLNAAQINSFEGLPIFLASVLTAMSCFVPQNIINVLACLYVILRLIYGMAYAFNLPTFRSAIWGLSVLCCLQLFYFSIKML